MSHQLIDADAVLTPLWKAFCAERGWDPVESDGRHAWGDTSTNWLRLTARDINGVFHISMIDCDDLRRGLIDFTKETRTLRVER